MGWPNVSSAGSSRMSSASVAGAMVAAMPTAAIVSHAFSQSDCRAMRAQPDPSAMRIAVSFARAIACVVWALGLAYCAWAVGSLLATFGPWLPEKFTLDAVRHWGRHMLEWNWAAIGKWGTLTALCGGMVIAIGVGAVKYGLVSRSIV